MNHPSSASAIIAQMKAIVEAPSYQFLQAYKSDFYEVDCEMLQSQYADKTRFLWVVTQNGTHLTRIGVHPRSNQSALVTLSSGARSSSLGCEIYLIAGGKVKKITEQQAITEVAMMQYSVKDRTVFSKTGEMLAAFSVQSYFKQGDGNPYADVKFQTSQLPLLSASDLTALVTIGVDEAVSATQSLFVKIPELTINGFDLSELATRHCTQAVQASPMALTV